MSRRRPLVLMIEDESDIAELVVFNLERDGFRVKHASTAEQGFRRLQQELPDLVLLDLMLPDVPGLEVCRRLRQETRTRSLPVIILTARDQESDVVLGLELGADDYVTKPFSVRELVSRIRAVLRRSRREPGSEDSEVISLGDLEIDSGRFEVRVKGRPHTLTPAEFRLLRVLASRPGQVMSRDQLLDHVTGGRSVIIDRNVDVHVRSIRKKLGPAADCIVTVHGVGYKVQP